MNRMLMAMSAALLAGQVCSPVAAQPGSGSPGGRGGFGRSMGGGIGILLMNEAVRDEVRIEQEQLEELEVLREEMGQQMRDRFEKMRDLTPEERRDAVQDMRAEMEALREEVEGRIGEVLTTSQLKRLRQIHLQQQMQRGGSRALLSSSVAEKLGISLDQQEELRKKSQEEGAKLRDQIQKLTLESRERVLEVLTDQQRAQLKQMVGERFDMPDQQFRGPGGPRGNRPARRPRPELE